MHEIDELIRQVAPVPPGTVVHIGAGRGAVLERYARLAPSCVVLVEGDPETAARLRRAARPYPWARVVAEAVGPARGPITWHRYNLSTLNGPLAADALVRAYPRLHRESVSTLPAVDLSGVLRSAAEGRDGTRSVVLVLDVPGQEIELVDSLGNDVVGLSALIVRRRLAPLVDAPVRWSTFVGRLREQCFELVGQEADDDPYGPVAVFRFDADRHAIRTARRERDAARSEVARLHAELAATRAAAEAREAALEAQREATLTELRQARDEQAATLDATMRDKAALEQQLRDVTKMLDSERCAARALEVRVESLDAAVRTAVGLRSSIESDIRELQARYGALAADHRTRTEQLRQCAERLVALQAALRSVVDAVAGAGASTPQGPAAPRAKAAGTSGATRRGDGSPSRPSSSAKGRRR